MKKIIMLVLLMSMLTPAYSALADVCFLSSGIDTVMIKGRFRNDPLVESMCEIGRKNYWIATRIEYDNCDSVCEDLMMHVKPAYDISFGLTPKYEGVCWVFPLMGFQDRISQTNHFQDLFEKLKPVCIEWNEGTVH
jgi:hypothetical protein